MLIELNYYCNYALINLIRILVEFICYCNYALVCLIEYKITHTDAYTYTALVRTIVPAVAPVINSTNKLLSRMTAFVIRDQC